MRISGSDAIIAVGYRVNSKQATDFRIWATNALKVRESNNFESDIIGTIAMGEKISVLEDNGEWSKISYKQSNGYILNEYVDFNIA